MSRTTHSKNLCSIILDASASMGSTFMVDNELPTRHMSSVSKIKLCKEFVNTYICMRCAESKTVEFAVTTFGQDPDMNENHLREG